MAPTRSMKAARPRAATGKAVSGKDTDQLPLADRPSRSVNRGPLPGYYGYNLRIAQVAVFDNFAKIVGRLADRMGELTPGRFSLLTLLRHNPGINQTDLSKAVGLDKSTLTPALDQLEKKGLIIRERTAKDRRTYALRLSEKGEALLSDLTAKVELHEENIVAALTPAERASLLRLLKKISRSLGSGAVE